LFDHFHLLFSTVYDTRSVLDWQIKKNRMFMGQMDRIKFTSNVSDAEVIQSQFLAYREIANNFEKDDRSTKDDGVF
tara:strand:- start:4818 stop:5045 length:228 start_codon:yes stop_codon:yes gene_type:complete